jgi:hypothetical protein
MLDEDPSPEPSFEANARQERDGTCAGEPCEVERQGDQQENRSGYMVFHV